MHCNEWGKKEGGPGRREARGSSAMKMEATGNREEPQKEVITKQFLKVSRQHQAGLSWARATQTPGARCPCPWPPRATLASLKVDSDLVWTPRPCLCLCTTLLSFTTIITFSSELHTLIKPHPWDSAPLGYRHGQQPRPLSIAAAVRTTRVAKAAQEGLATGCS